MTPHQQAHESLTNLLAKNRLESAQSLWLELADTHAGEPDFLLALIKEFVAAGHHFAAAELAGFIAPNFKTAGKLHEWLYALKLQAVANPTDKPLRTEIVEAYRAIYGTDPRLKNIITVAQLDEPKSPLPAAIARTDTLLALAPGAYCQHKSWGFGRVTNFDATLGRLLIAFPHNPDHAIQLTYAADSLTPIPADHIEVRKVTDLPNLQQLAGNDPLALLRLALANFHHALTADRLEALLTPAIIPTANWKKWWDNTKKLAKRDPHFEVPARKTDPVILRTVPVSQQDELREAFQQAPGLDQKTDIARQLLKIADEIDDPELLLQEFQDGLLAAIAAGKGNIQAQRLEAAFVVEDLRARQKAPAESSAPLVANLLSQITSLSALLEKLSTAGQKRLLGALKTTQPDRLTALINQLETKLLDEIPDLLDAQADRMIQHVQNQTAGIELLLWVCRAYTDPKGPAWVQRIPGPALLAAVYAAIENAEYRSTTKRLRDQLLNDDTLITELLAAAPVDVIRNHARAMLTSSAFEELDRRSLLARIVKEFPFVQDLLVTRTTKEAPLIVSSASLRRRQAELDDIIQKQIPANSKEIGQARSYGDLRENFEFKAAKDTQKLLMRRRGELEILLTKAQPSDFTNVKTDVVNIGTSVVVTDTATGQSQTFHILGAWDSDPARGIISYPAALAQSLLNKHVGDTVEVAGDQGRQTLRLDSITPVPDVILQNL
jgi:transcription elongation GreA/GreB family factor